MSATLHRILTLARVSNLPTVWSNCLAAWFISGAHPSWSMLPLLIGASLLYAGVMTFVILKVLSAVSVLKAETRLEGLGMDVTQHGEEAYTSGEGSILVLPNTTESTATAPALAPSTAR